MKQFIYTSTKNLTYVKVDVFNILLLNIYLALETRNRSISPAIPGITLYLIRLIFKGKKHKNIIKPKRKPCVKI
jgi:hypothetical protein